MRKKPKFKVGDRVRVLLTSEEDREHNEEFVKCNNSKIFTIVKVKHYVNDFEFEYYANKEYFFTEDEIESIEPKQLELFDEN